MPITEAFATRKMCSGPPKQSYLEKRKIKKVDFSTVLKANPFHVGRGGPHAGEFTSKARAGAPTAFDPKDAMRVSNMLAAGDKALRQASTMAKSITTWEKAHRRANAAEAAGQSEMAKIFRARADELRKGGALSAAEKKLLPKTPKGTPDQSSGPTWGQYGSKEAYMKAKGYTPEHVPTTSAGINTLVATPETVAGVTAVKPHATAASVAGVVPQQVGTGSAFEKFMQGMASMTARPAATTVSPAEAAHTKGKYTPTYDKEGYVSGKSAPESKDDKRIEDMAMASRDANGKFDHEKMLRKAQQMAKSITNADKAYRRAMAAESANHHSVAKVFYDRADELSH